MRTIHSSFALFVIHGWDAERIGVWAYGRVGVAEKGELGGERIDVWTFGRVDVIAKEGVSMLGQELERNIREAWLRVRNEILTDPDELRRRLARRRMKSLTRPPRAWCVAIRASDRRITPAHWVIAPEHAMDLDHPHHPL